MGSSAEGPNPLRPYYIPPSIGLPKAPPNAPPPPAAGALASKTNIRNSTRDIFSDFDYSEYLGEASPTISDSIKELVDKALWRYGSVLMAQPFEVAKTILQVYVVQEAQEELSSRDQRRRDQGYRDNYYEDDSANSSDDESSYFTSDAPLTPSASASRNRRPPPRITDRRGYIPSSASKSTLKIKDPSALFDVISQLWSSSGATSLWKASNSSFIYSLLLPTLNTFIRSLLSAILAFPEDGLTSLAESDILTSTSPGTSLLLTCISSALSAILLSPIDTTRTYLILTPLSHGPRSLLRAIRLLPTPNYLIPPHLLPITILNSTLPSLLTGATPILLKSYLSLDPVINPSSWSVFTFLASGLELGLRFPLETVLRRAQIATFTSPALRQQSALLPSPTSASSPLTPAKKSEQPPVIETIVPTPQSYRGIIGTMWTIVYEEGTNPHALELESIDRALGRGARAREPEGTTASRQAQKRRQGQGVQGLYRGWRLGMWALVGVWGSGFLGTALGAGDDEMIPGPAGARMAMETAGGRSGGSSRGAF
ncbi:mitochondrial fusion and transport protein ugo1 [Emmonsiellopsis sp. PD_33]|nr:mitochondrial fusion and transport protein ugo1 [Emmonsiellopsis sp. PD_33]